MSVLCVCNAIMLCCISVWYQCYVYVMLHLGVMSVLCVCDAVMLCRILMWYQCYVYVMPSCYVASRCDISVVYVMPSCYVASRCDISVMCMWCQHVMLHLSVISVLCVCDAIMLCCCDAIMLCCISVYCHHVMLHLGGFRNFWEPLLKYENVVFNGEQKQESFVWGLDRKISPLGSLFILSSIHFNFTLLAENFWYFLSSAVFFN